MEANKYKIIDKNHPRYGQKIYAARDEEFDDIVFVEEKTGEVFDIQQLQYVPEKHAIYGGFHIGRFGLFLFGREYIKYRSYQFGVCIDFIKSGDTYMDVEFRVACFGIGIRFVWIKKI